MSPMIKNALTDMFMFCMLLFGIGCVLYSVFIVAVQVLFWLQQGSWAALPAFLVYRHDTSLEAGPIQLIPAFGVQGGVGNLIERNEFEGVLYWLFELPFSLWVAAGGIVSLVAYRRIRNERMRRRRASRALN
jgi:hypothetical protein